MNPIFTIGHSTHSSDEFINLLKAHEVTAVGDVRSSPYSKFNPQFNRELLRGVLNEEEISYVFLGEELGPRSRDPDCYDHGRISYERLARTELFKKGIERLKKGARMHRIALMCAEKDPIVCHRMILVCRNIRSIGYDIYHILEDGSTETLRESEKRLLKLLNIPELQLFETPEDLICRAYKIQGEKIAYRKDSDEQERNGFESD